MVKEMIEAPRVPSLGMIGVIPPEGKEDKRIQRVAAGEKIGPILREAVLEATLTSFEMLTTDPERSRLLALENYTKIQLTVRTLSEDSELLSSLKSSYGPVVMANFTFSLSQVTDILPLLVLATHLQRPGPLDSPDIDGERISSRLRQLVPLASDEIPDALAIRDEPGQYNKILSQLVIMFNIGMLFAVVFLTATIARSRTGLTQVQVRELEYLLRDWGQEAITQIYLMNDENPFRAPLSRFVGFRWRAMTWRLTTKNRWQQTENDGP